MNSHNQLGLGVGHLVRTGIIYIVERTTGAVRHLSTSEYMLAERDNLLCGFFVRLDPLAAESLAAEIRAQAVQTN